MNIKLGDKFESEYTETKELKVVKIYNPNQFVVQEEGSGRRILCGRGRNESPELCLAHVPKQQIELKKKEGELPWLN